MPSLVYNALEGSDISWSCCQCGLPNFQSSLFMDYEESASCTTPSATSFASNDSSLFGSPQFTSSPSRNRRKQPTAKKKLRVLIINFQSIRAKKEPFWALLEQADPDIVLASETWLYQSIAEREVLPDNYCFVSRRDRPNSTHGGVAIIAKRDIEATEVVNSANSEFIAASFNTTSMKKPIIIGCLYRPTDDSTQYSQDISREMHQLFEKYRTNPIWIGGDANLPDIDWSTDTIKGHQYPIPINQQFLDTFNDIGVEQVVDFPTRNNNLLDIFCTNRPSLVDRCSPIPGISDHDIVLVDSNIIPKRQKPIQRRIFLWKKANTDAMKNELSTFSDKFTQEYNTTTPINTLWSIFKSQCSNTINKYVPSKLTTTRYNQPWCNRLIRRLAKRKKRAYKRARRSGDRADWGIYQKIQKENQRQCRNARDEYVSGMVSEPGTHNKKLYSYVKSQKSDSSGVSPLKREGVTYSDTSAKAEILNDQFSSVFTKEDFAHTPDMGPDLQASAPPLHIHDQGVRKLMEDLNPHKATGPDEISSRFLKENARELSPALSLIFQASHDQSNVPDDWRNALVTPLFKKGDKSKAANYRPVSLTSICCKIMEHIVHSHVMKFLDNNNLLSDQQHGFRKRRSCESQLINTVQDLAAGLNDKQQIDAILLDFSKAFDKVPHQRLSAKLHHYGIRGKTLGWINSFLAHRQQQVVLDGKTSSPAPVTSGVPQGTVLGPLLFLVYINDLPDKVSSTARLFADDCLLYRTISSAGDSRALQEDLDRLQEWERDWQMLFNPDKCEMIRITNKRKVVEGSYNIHGHTLKQTNKAKYLGVTIDGSLTWNSHIDATAKKANNTTAFLRRNLSMCPRTIKANCYKTLVRPQLEYAAAVWDPSTQTNINKLEQVQRRAARFTTGDYRHTSSVTAMMKQLDWETLQARRQQSKAVMMYRVINNLVEVRAQGILVPAGVHTRGHGNRYQQPFTRVECYKASFFPSGIKLWNSLPENVVTAPSLDVFKTRMGALQG